MIISVFDRVENIVGKGQIACTSNFSFSHNVFKRLLSWKRQKVSLCGNGEADHSVDLILKSMKTYLILYSINTHFDTSTTESF